MGNKTHPLAFKRYPLSDLPPTPPNLFYYLQAEIKLIFFKFTLQINEVSIILKTNRMH
jgi:hypothetical protein